MAPSDVVGIATDFTASTPLPTLRDGTPLCSLLPDRPHAYPKLWKHHAAQPEADRVNAVAEERGEPWLARYGGRISSEWEFAKALQVLDEDPEIYDRAERWIEAADWIVWQLCGQEVRNVCSTGYKAIYQDGQLPVRGLPARARRALRRLPVQARRAARRARRPRRLADRRGRRVDRAARGDRGGGRQRRRARHGARRAGDRRRPDAHGHGHLDVPHHERRRAGRGAGHVRRRRRRRGAGPVGLRGGPERGRRHLRLVRRPGGAARVPRGGATAAGSTCTRTCPSWPARCASASTGSSCSTGTTAIARSWSTTS